MVLRQSEDPKFPLYGELPSPTLAGGLGGGGGLPMAMPPPFHPGMGLTFMPPGGGMGAGLMPPYGLAPLMTSGGGSGGAGGQGEGGAWHGSLSMLVWGRSHGHPCEWLLLSWFLPYATPRLPLLPLPHPPPNPCRRWLHLHEPHAD